MTKNTQDLELEISAEEGDKVDIVKEIYVASIKLRGLGELFCMARSEPPMSDGGFIGVSEFLIDISNDLDGLLDRIRSRL